LIMIDGSLGHERIVRWWLTEDLLALPGMG
jgi:hypothetical protein